MDTILRISTQANLAMHAMAYVVQSQGEPSCTVRRLADELGVSEAHLAKVMQRLVRTGFLRSKRGPSGGFRLERAPDTISLLEIVETFDGRMAEHSCALGKKRCLHGGCALGALLMHVNYQVKTFLKSHTLSAMLASDRAHARFLAALGNQEASRGTVGRSMGRRGNGSRGRARRTQAA